MVGEIRQSSFVDFDGDGDLDLFVAVRDAPNMLFRNDGARFTSVGKELGIDDPRRTVGAVWFDMDVDGDLDVFVANQNGDLNGLFRNDGARFVDVAKDLGVDAAGRASTSGSNGPSVADFDNDGDLDLFVASYGPNLLYRNDGPGKFTEIAAEVGLAGGALATPSRWGDFDNDGRIDLYVSSYIDKPVNERDFLFHNDGGRFTDVIPELIAKRGATHGIQWVDFDSDGDLDFSLANNNPNGTHSLYRNLLPAGAGGARRSGEGAWTPRAAPRVPARRCASTLPAPARCSAWASSTAAAATARRTSCRCTSGSARAGRVDIEVTTMAGRRRTVTRRAALEPRAGAVEVVRTP